MGELEKSTGKIKIDSAICAKGFAYVGQDCWIKAGTIKENILFGAPMNDAFYRKVIEACALTSDLNMFPKADETYVSYVLIFQKEVGWLKLIKKSCYFFL